MAGQDFESAAGATRADEVYGVSRHHIVLAGSAFALGVAVGLVLRDAAKQIYERARLDQWQREYRRTVAYDENLPDSLERREPAPHPGQPRFGGTGALGVSPASVPPGESATRSGDDG